MTAITLFEQPQQLPDYLKTSAVAKAIAEQIDGGLAGKSINRISLRNGKFRFIRGGVEVGIARTETLDTVIIAANPHVGRLYYAKAFDPDDTGTRPDCYSITGREPEADSQTKQCNTCALCPQNIVGSAKNGQGRACSFKKRVVVVAHDAIGGEPWAIDVAGMGLFGDDDPPQRLFNLKSYIEALKANHLIVPAVVTRLSFDDEASVPKLFFTPVRVLSAAEFAQVEARQTDPTVREMLADMDLKTEEGKPVNVTALPQATAPATPPPVAQPATAPATAAPAAPSTRRGRRPAAQTAPAAAPAPTPAPAAAPATAPAAGFGMSAVPPANAAAAPAAPVAGGFTLDMDAFDA